MSFFAELKRRNVFRVGIAYVVAAWVLLQVADLVLEAINAPEWVLQSLMLFIGLGFVASVVVAWAYEITPEGIKREREVQREESITGQTGRKLDRIIIGFLVVAVAVLLYRQSSLGPDSGDPVTDTAAPRTAQTTAAAEPEQTASTTGTTSAAGKSVAVLPFVAMSSGQDDEYFADGLTEEILNSLAQLPELLVTARTSSFHFKGKEIPVQDIAETLGVAHIVEGSVRRSGDRLRVTAQLVRASDGFHTWSENYDSTSSDTIQVQEDIAEKIALALNVVMDDEKREAMRDAGLRDVEAFVTMQKARELYGAAHGEGDQVATLKAANELYEQVLERVPGYPPALEEHSDLYVHMLNDDATGSDRPRLTEKEVTEARARMLEDVSLALENARNFSEQNELEINLSYLSGNWRGIEPRVQRYIEGSGCSRPSWAPQFALPFGDARAFAGRIHAVTECDPMSSANWFDETRAWLWAGDAEEALRVVKRGMEVAPGGWLPFALNWALIANGEFEEMEHAINTNLLLPGDRQVAQLFRLAAMGQADAIESLIPEVEAKFHLYGFQELLLYSRIGDREAANRIAAHTDQHVQGPQSLLAIILWCMCGAPFDLEATPNFAQKLQEAALPWPPRSPIDWPLKDW